MLQAKLKCNKIEIKIYNARIRYRKKIKLSLTYPIFLKTSKELRSIIREGGNKKGTIIIIDPSIFVFYQSDCFLGKNSLLIWNNGVPNGF